MTARESRLSSRGPDPRNPGGLADVVTSLVIRRGNFSKQVVFRSLAGMLHPGLRILHPVRECTRGRTYHFYNTRQSVHRKLLEVIYQVVIFQVDCAHSTGFQKVVGGLMSVYPHR